MIRYVHYLASLNGNQRSNYMKTASYIYISKGFYNSSKCNLNVKDRHQSKPFHKIQMHARPDIKIHSDNVLKEMRVVKDVFLFTRHV